MQVIENNLLDLLLDFLGLAQNDIALTFNSGLFKLGILQDIRQDVDAPGNIGVEGFSEVNGILALKTVRVSFLSRRRSRWGEGIYSHRGIGIQVATHVLNFKF